MANMKNNAYRVDCPRCRSVAGEPCTYVQTGQYRDPRWISANERLKQERWGDPKSVPCNERINAFSRLMQRQREREYWEREGKIKQSLTQVLTAVRQFDLLEYRAMQEFLADNPDLFKYVFRAPAGSTDG